MLYIFNTTIAPTPGLTYHTRIITAHEARDLVSRTPTTSAIGHEATAQIATVVLGTPVNVNRIAAKMVAGDSAICVKLRGRTAEGVILSAEEVESIGYDLVLMEAVRRPYPEDAWVAAMRGVGATLLAGPDGVHPGLPDIPGAHHVVFAWRDGDVVGTAAVGTDYQQDLRAGRLGDGALISAWLASGGKVAHTATWERPRQ